jgi:hypothetical protein
MLTALYDESSQLAVCLSELPCQLGAVCEGISGVVPEGEILQLSTYTSTYRQVLQLLVYSFIIWVSDPKARSMSDQSPRCQTQ